jgi:Kef-type K+ transport system membrane component KefB
MLPQILGFFCAGVVLNQFGLIRNLTDVKLLSEWGILFLVGTNLWEPR